MLAVLVEVLVVPVLVEGVLVAEVMVVAVAVAGRTVAPGAVFFFKMSAAPKVPNRNGPPCPNRARACAQSVRIRSTSARTASVSDFATGSMRNGRGLHDMMYDTCVCADGDPTMGGAHLQPLSHPRDS